MSKNIVFCADGTWNGPGEPDSDDADDDYSNVYKLFLKLKGDDEPGTTRLANEQEKKLLAADGSVTQIAKYLHGVGDSRNFLAKLMGGGIGTGLITRIVRGYTFVSRNYVAGDRIYLVGFSRGAYTARALAGLISAKGLLPPEVATSSNKEEAYRAGSAVWYEWRREAMRARGLSIFGLQGILRDLPGFFSDPPQVRLVPAPIEVVAVWDTVGSLGIPQLDQRGVAVDAFKFADTNLSNNVKFGRHAVSIDECRRSFEPTLWTSAAPDPRIVQVMFPGGHSDVGGGYPLENGESGLSDCALKWMTGELESLGVQIGPPVIPEKPDPCGIGHQEWMQLRWVGLSGPSRRLPDAPELHLSEAVIRRLNGDKVLPDSLPKAVAAAYLPANIATYLNGKAAAIGITIIPL